MRRVALSGPRANAWEGRAPTTRRERARGLRGAAPRPHEALVIERCRSVHTFGMQPITVAFLDASWRVIRVDRAPGRRILYCRRARHVVETHVGADLRVGDGLERRSALP